MLMFRPPLRAGGLKRNALIFQYLRRRLCDADGYGVCPHSIGRARSNERD